MYTPNQQIVRSSVGYTDWRDSTGMGPETQLSLDKVKRKYEETEDFYDIQAKSMASLNKVLEDAKPRDYQYLNEKVTSKRDELAQLFKGKTLKDIRTPEFQTQYLQIMSDLGKTKAKSESSIEQTQELLKLMEQRPSMQRGRVRELIEQQLSLSPDERMDNLIEHATTDPQYMNGFDFVANNAKKYEETIKTLSRERTTPNQILNEEIKYYSEVGEFDSKGNFVMKPSDRFVDGLLEDKQFYNLMVGMLPPAQAKELSDSGNDSMLQEAVRDVAKQYITQVKELQPKATIASTRAKPQPTARDREENKHNQTVNAVMKGVLNKDATVLQPYLMGAWHSFEFETGPSGRVTGVLAYGKEKDMTGLREKKAAKPIYFPISEDAFSSTEKMLETLKFTHQGDKEKVQLSDPDSSPTKSSSSQKKGTFWVDGL